MAFDLGAQRLFFEFRLFHQPMREPAQKIEMRPAALEAARPEPHLIGEKQPDPAFAFAREDEQRLRIGAGKNRRAARHIGIDLAEPAAPGRRIVSWRRAGRG